MRATEFITERKRKKQRKSRRAYGGYFYPGFGYGDNSSGEGGGDGGGESVNESPIDELVKELPTLAKHSYDNMDRLLKKIAGKHKISDRALERLFTKKFKKTPQSWFDGRLDEDNDTDLQGEVDKFVEWTAKRLNLKKVPAIELSMDTEEAQGNHHTGGHVPGEDSVWVYAKNRNLVDILRTVFHELVHVRQHEIGMIKPGDSYPGSPIESMADMLAGKYIKIYGEKNNHIFQ
jgi:hypothetical protein